MISNVARAIANNFRRARVQKREASFARNKFTYSAARKGKFVLIFRVDDGENDDDGDDERFARMTATPERRGFPDRRRISRTAARNALQRMQAPLSLATERVIGMKRDD